MAGWYEIQASQDQRTHWRRWDGNAWTSEVTYERPAQVVAVAPASRPTVAAYGPATLRGVPLASWGYRVGAFVVDAGLAVTVALGAALIAKSGGASAESQDSALIITLIAVWVLVTSVASAITHGQSVGKAVGGMRVVRAPTGEPVGFGWSLLRDTIARLLYVIPLFWLLDSLFPAGEKRESIRDKMVGTRVLQDSAYGQRAVVLAVVAIAVIGSYAGLVAAGGGFSSDYSDADRDAFVETCVDEGTNSDYCGCVFDYVRQRESYDDYLEADATERMSDWPVSFRQTFDAAVEACQ
jgi:uncharacterized RDD family membrane protein YckC